MPHPSRQLSYSHGTGDIPLLPYTIGQMLNKTADEYPDKEIYVFCADKERYTFKDFKNKTHQFAAGLLQLGLQKGDKVAVWGFAHMEYMLTYHACAQIGLILVRLISPPVTDLNGQLLKRIGCKALVLNRTPVNAYSEVCKLVPELSNSEPGKIDSESLPDLKIVIGAEETFANCKGILTIAEVIKLGGSSADAVERITRMAWNIGNEDDFSVIFTSGSTGIPKAVTHSQQAFLNSIRMGGSYRKGTDFQRDWVPKVGVLIPPSGIGHEYQVLQPVLTGNTTVFLCPMYNADEVLKSVHEERCTELVCLLHHLHDLANHPDVDKYDWSCMKMIMTGGSVIPEVVLKAVKQKLSKHVMLGYGATECCVNFLQSPTDDTERLTSASIKPTPHTEVKIIDETGRTVPTNTSGEIYIRGYSVFKYYWGDEEATQKAKSEDGWFRTGDIGEMDDDGYLRILGRKKEVIIKGAWTFFPKELETVLDRHEDVSKAVVFGVPDERLSEEVCACVKLKSSPATDTNSQNLVSFCKGKVNDLLVPGHLFIVKELPTTATGKFHRKELREWAIGQLKEKS